MMRAHTFHALLHSYRLTADSWKRSVELANSTFCSTGDLGIEKGIGNYKKTLFSLFGTWPRDSDRSGETTSDDEDAADVAAASDANAEQEFHMEIGVCVWGGRELAGQPQEIQGEVDGGQEVVFRSNLAWGGVRVGSWRR